ncbi:MAG: hypothetical protein MJZ93_07160, partial [Paludibacteraceae bacterium]|nr:hypothetical protein [Paludibacteraceae bacterium]
MKNIRSAVVAMLIAVAVTGCKESNLDKTIISVTEVTESSISGSCAYTPSKKNDDGYMIFLCKTDELTNEIREELIDAYSTYAYGPLYESVQFTFDSLASDRTYYIVAVTYNKTNGEVALGDIETLAQRTMASNDNRVTTSVNGQKVTLTMAIDDNGYTVDLNDVLGGNKFSYKLHIILDEPTVVDSISGTNCYQDGKIVFTVDCDEEQTTSVTEHFYAYAPTENENEYKKYEAVVRLSKKTKNTCEL